MRIAALITAFLCLWVEGGQAQTPTNHSVPAAVTVKLKPIMDRIKFTEPLIVQAASGQFTRMREVASVVKVYPALSDFADKPYQARVKWTSTRLHTKIYSEREGAEKATDWLPPGKVPGKDSMRASGAGHEALFYYKNGSWELDSLKRGSDFVGFTEIGEKSPWYKVLKPDPKKIEKK